MEKWFDLAYQNIYTNNTVCIDSSMILWSTAFVKDFIDFTGLKNYKWKSEDVFIVYKQRTYWLAKFRKQ